MIVNGLKVRLERVLFVHALIVNGLKVRLESVSFARTLVLSVGSPARATWNKGGPK